MSDTQYEADTFLAAQVFALWQLWPFSALKMFTILIHETNNQARRTKGPALASDGRREWNSSFSLNNSLSPTQALVEIESEKKERAEKLPATRDALWRKYGTKRKQQVEKSKERSLDVKGEIYWRGGA